MPRRYFDLHLHPVLKTMFKYAGEQLSPWHTISVNDNLFKNALDSQASLGQIARNIGMNLVCMPVYAPEMALIAQWKLILGSFFYLDQMNPKRLTDMGSGKLDYATLRREERAQITRAPQSADGSDLSGKRVRLISKWSDYNPADLNTIHILFNVEGAHNFYGAGNDSVDTTAMLQNFRTLIEGDTLVLYVTPAHLAPNVLLNHAFGIKIFGKTKFLPQGDGIYNVPFPPKQPAGKKNLYDFFNLAHERGVMIDVKHMALRSRKQFYKHHDENYFSDRPVFASHVGFTGISWKDIGSCRIDAVRFAYAPYEGYKIRYRKPAGHLQGTFFNPCSINMYDEDLLAVLRSGGLVGLSMDVRIMGADSKAGATAPEDSEYISKWELSEFDLQPAAVTKAVVVNVPPGMEGMEVMDADDIREHEEEMASALELNGDRFHLLHLRHFINHLLHLCMLRKKHNLPVHPLTQVCIGSDFDGLIQSLHCCQNVSQLPHFADDLREALPGCAKEAGIELGMPIDEILDRVFQKNAYDFMTTHYGKLAAGGYRKPK